VLPRFARHLWRERVGPIVLGILVIIGLLIAIFLIYTVAALWSDSGRRYLHCLHQSRRNPEKSQQCCSDFDRDFDRETSFAGTPRSDSAPPPTNESSIPCFVGSLLHSAMSG
jgi:hypothetical protein